MSIKEPDGTAALGAVGDGEGFKLGYSSQKSPVYLQKSPVCQKKSPVSGVELSAVGDREGFILG